MSNPVLDYSAVLTDAMTPVLEAIQEQIAAMAEAMQVASEEMTASMDAVAESVQLAAESMSEAATSIDANTMALEENTAAADENAGAHDASVGSLGKLNMALLGAGVAAAAATVASVVMASNFQAGVETLVTGAGEAQSNVGMLSAGLLKLATDTGTSTKQLIDGAFMIESAGFHGAAALNVLQAAAEGAKVGNADLGSVADATTTILKDYPNVMNGASGAVNDLIATVANGKTHMEDLSKSLSQILPTASAAHVGLNDVMGAMATMTGEGIPAANAATYLRQTILALDAPSAAAKKALESVGLTTQQVSDEMQKSLPDTIAMITDAVGKKFPPGSAAYVAALKDISGGSKTMQGMLDLSGAHLQDFQSNVKSVTDSVKNSGNAINGWGAVQQTVSQKFDKAREVLEALFISIGTHLLPAVGKMADIFVSTVAPALQQFANLLETNRVALSIVAGILAGVFLAALTTILAPLGAALLAATPLIAAFSGLAIVAALLVSHWHDITAAWNDSHSVLGQIHQAIQPLFWIMQSLAGAIVPSLKSVWSTLTDSFKQMMPTLKSIGDELKPLLPYLKDLAEVVGGVVVVAVGIVIGVLRGLANAFSGLAVIVKSAVGLITGLILLVLDTVTGQWGKLPGVVNGIWNSMIGLFKGAGQAILGFISGFVQGIIDFFTHLWSELVGHSIIPDMISAIIQWFLKLPGEIIGMIAGFVGNLLSKFSQLASQAIAAAMSMVTGIISNLASLPGKALTIIAQAISGIAGAISGGAGTVIGAVGGLVSGVVGAISSLPGKFLSIAQNCVSSFANEIKNIPVVGGVAGFAGNVIGGIGNALGIHSPSTVFRDMAQYSVDGFVQGLQQHGQRAADSTAHLGNSIAAAFAPSLSASSAYGSTSAASLSSAGGSGMTVNIVLDNSITLLDSNTRRQIATQLVDEMSQAMARKRDLQVNMTTSYPGR